MVTFNETEQYIKQARNLPDEWEAYHFAAGGYGNKKIPAGYTKVSGAVAPKLPNGERDWGKKDMASDATFMVKNADVDAWADQREKETGKCRRCCGEGKEWTGWSREHGSRFKTCSKCGGTGSIKQETATA